MFQGYSQETVDFMWGIRFNNERGWFLAHKDDYQQHLLAPTRELGQAVYDGLAAALPHEPLILKVSRIYRDARRLASCLGGEPQCVRHFGISRKRTLDDIQSQG